MVVIAFSRFVVINHFSRKCVRGAFPVRFQNPTREIAYGKLSSSLLAPPRTKAARLRNLCQFWREGRVLPAHSARSASFLFNPFPNLVGPSLRRGPLRLIPRRVDGLSKFAIFGPTPLHSSCELGKGPFPNATCEGLPLDPF